ncbi:MAG: radical SAM protein [Candidatus Omnitrophica bacterium]|nr:radical SAM protein [Candidatus Omnitrophota bacterium]
MLSLMAAIKRKLKGYRKTQIQKQMNSRTISQEGLRLWIDEENRFRIYYKDNEITKWFGLSTGIFSDGKWYSSSDCSLKIEKVSQGEFFIYFNFTPLPLIQVWHLVLMPQNIISWDVHIQLKDSLRVDRRNAALFLSKNYQEWTVPLAQDNFQTEFTKEWTNIVLSENNPDFIGVISSSQDFPSITLKNDGGPNTELAIQNTDERFSARVLKMQLEEKEEIYSSGTYRYFKAIIEFYPDKIILEDKLQEIRESYERGIFLQQEEERKRQEELAEEERKRQEELAEEERKRQEELAEEERKRQEERKAQEKRNRTLQNSNLKIYIDEENRVHIYNNGSEITKWWGLYTRILSEGRWFGSSDSEAQIDNLSSQELVAHLTHKHLPITYRWHLVLKDNNLLWEESIQVRDSLRIDQSNASLFLSKGYNDWFSRAKMGGFPAFSPEFKDIHLIQRKPFFIGLTSHLKDFPSILLYVRHIGKDDVLTIQNSDAIVSSRVLTAAHEEKKELIHPGVYPNFKISIKFYKDVSVLERVMNRFNRRLVKSSDVFQLAENLELDSLKTHTVEDNEVFVFGDSQIIHDRISGTTGDFEKVISKLKLPFQRRISIKIGISKYNFFRLNEIAQFYSNLINQRVDLRCVTLDIFPVKKLYTNFIEYVKELQLRIQTDNISFFLKDQDLPQLLHTVSSQADQYNEKDLIRLLGVIVEHPFIGPQTIVIDTFHKCNTNCIHCWIHTPVRKLSVPGVKAKMDFELFKGIVDNAVELLCDEIIFQGDGEPLLDDRFFEMAGYARDKGLKVLFFTNAILLDEEKAKKIVDLEINEIFCSLPAGTEETYARINSSRTKETFHKVVNNLKHLMHLREKSGKNKPLLQMTHVIHNLNYHELGEMAKIDALIGADKTRFYLARLDKNIKSLQLEAEHISFLRKSLKDVEQFLKKEDIELQNNIKFQLENYNPTTGDWSEELPFRLGCPVGWFFSLILAKGDVSICCHLRIIDSINGKCFKEIWNSGEYNKIRIQAKYIAENKEATLANGIKLYDEFCKHCDTHQVIFRINELMDKYSLSKFLLKL